MILFRFRLISDTRHAAEAALKASSAYQNIIDAIDRALNASNMAINVAEEAVTHVSSQY